MGGYISAPLVVDAEALAADALDYLVANIPGWVPREGHLEVWQIEALARMVSTAASVGASVSEAIFRWYGETLVDVPPIQGLPALVNTTWVMSTTAGFTIPAGTLAAFRTAGDALALFATVEDVTIPPGSSTTTAGGVAMAAVERGEQNNGLAAGAMVLVDSLAYISSVTATTVTAGGADTESDADYIDRLADEMTLLSPRPILPNDFAQLARRLAGVRRAAAVDGYKPPPGELFNQERTVAVAAVDVAGVAVSAAIKAQLASYLTSLREINFVVNVIDPTTTVVNVVFTATRREGYAAADVEARAEEAVADYLSPAAWGGGLESPPAWRNVTKVRHWELVTVLNNVDGLDVLSTLTINGVAGDLTLTGQVPLPAVGTITGSVT